MIRAVLKTVLRVALHTPASSDPARVTARAVPKAVPDGKIVPLHGLRAAAALGVAFSHFHNVFLQVGRDNTMGILGFGVDLFFVISGFIMVHVTRDEFGSAASSVRFFCRRLIRIAPLYWLCTLAFLHYVLSTQPIAKANLSWSQIGASFAFLPWTRPTGGAQPALDVGWTLNHEMFFYVCFAAVLFLPKRWALPALVIGLVAFLKVSRMWVLPTPFSVWATPLVYEFLIGVVLCAVLPYLPRINGWVALGLIVAGVVLVAKLYFSGKFSAWNRWYVWGSAAGLMVSAAVLYRGELTGWVKKVLCVLGDSSYAIYLIHPLVLYHAQNIAGTQHNYGDEWPIRTWTAVALMMAVSILLAITAHYMFERPVSRWLSAGLARVLPSPTSKPA